jgi:hypothetical protein
MSRVRLDNDIFYQFDIVDRIGRSTSCYTATTGCGVWTGCTSSESYRSIKDRCSNPVQCARNSHTPGERGLVVVVIKPLQDVGVDLER